MERHDTILITSANAEDRGSLRQALDSRFNLLEAGNLQQALRLLEQNADCIAAVMLASSAILGPDRELMDSGSARAMLESLPVIAIIDDDQIEEPAFFFNMGAFDVIPVHYDGYAMLRRVENIVQLHLNRQHLETVVQEQEAIQRQANDKLVDILSSLIEYRSAESGHHILRIRNFTRILMEEVMRHCPEYKLTDRLLTIISSASALHDIGKIAIPDAIFTKPGPLDPEEWAVMKTHTTTGCQILQTLGSMADQEYLRYAHNICHYHHERWDGSGYPEGLKGEQIPICAQVVGLADAYDALTSERVYKESIPCHRAVNMILKGECGQFSPKLLECFKNVTARFEALAREYADGRDPGDSPFDMTLPPPAPETNSLERVQAMYHSLVHYLNGFMIQVNLAQGVFHVVYNPYPDLADLRDITTLHQLVELMLNQVVIPEEREKMEKLLGQDLEVFLAQERRRATYWFHYQGQEGTPGGLFELTILRSYFKTGSFAIFMRKAEAWEPGRSGKATVFAERECICCNNRALTLVDPGQELSALMGPEAVPGGSLAEMIHPDDREMVRRMLRSQFEKGSVARLQHRLVRKDGGIRWVANRSSLRLGSDGQEYLHSTLLDITEPLEGYQALMEKHREYRDILTETQNVLFVWDVAADTIHFSDTWKRIFGALPPKKNVHRWMQEGSLFHPDDVPRLMDGISNLENGSQQESMEARIITGEGRYAWCRFRSHGHRDASGAITRIFGVITNVEAEKQAERLLRERAERDSLTRMLNKAAGRKRIQDYLAHYPDGVNCAMLIIDLDNFKQINDQYGHLFGDAVLTEVAQQISRQFKDQDITCRIGGDEFLVLARGLSSRQILENRCRRLIGSLGNELRNQHKKLVLGCSIGIALCPEHGTSYHELFNCADQALYQAKAEGKNQFCFYEEKTAFPTSLISATAISERIDSDEEPGLAEDNLVRHAFQLLYGATDVQAAVNQVIAYLGDRMNVSRVYVFENAEDNLTCSNTFEWCNTGIRPEIDGLQNISYVTDIPGYQDNFDEQGVFYCPDVAILPKSAYDIVAQQGIKSMLQCAIRQGNQFRGYIGFDECSRNRLWSKEEIQMLAYFSGILSTFLIRYREQERMQRQTEELQTILDNQNALIYIIDPETRELNYVNRKAKELLPGIRMGQPCYQGLMGKDTPCENCPAMAIRQQRTNTTVLSDGRFGTKVLAEATMIRWRGQESCLLTCRRLPQM